MLFSFSFTKINLFSFSSLNITDLREEINVQLYKNKSLKY